MASDFAKKLIRKHESTRLRVYDDADAKDIVPGKLVKGFPSIGVGRNLIGKGISAEEATFLFENDLIDAEVAIGNIFGLEIFQENEKRIAALLDMAHNLGEAGLRKFKKMIEAIRKKDWEEAAREAEDSSWFRQVGNRAIEDIDLLKEE